MNRISGSLLFLLFFASVTLLASDWIPGDLDFDGDVDFADFVTFAQNFGRTGGATGPETVTVTDTVSVRDIIPTTIQDTVKVTLRDTATTRITVIVAEAREPADSLEIPRLAIITVTGYWRNWDADADNDGIEVIIFPKDSLGDLVFSSEIPENISLTIEAKLYKDSNLDYLPDGPPVYTGKFEGKVADFLRASISMARIPKEQINVDPSKDYKYGILEASMTTPKQGSFSDRDTFVKLFE